MRSALATIVAVTVAMVVISLVTISSRKSPNGSTHEQVKAASAADFAKYAMELREQALLEVGPLAFVPTTSRPTIQRYPWRTNIVTTIFWIGEKEHQRSAWDPTWLQNYGGLDNPEPSARRNYIPVAFTPRLNPFCCALPYNDVSHGEFKPEAPLVIPWFKQAYTGPGAIRLPTSLDRDSQGEPNLLCTMGRLRPVPGRSLSIRFPK